LRITFTLLALSALTMAQEPSPQKQSDPLVKLSLIVMDRSKHSVDDLKKEEILILEDKVPQTVSLLTKDDRPIVYAVAIDNSGSFKKVLGPALDAVRMLINSKKDEDEVALIRFISSDKIETVQNFIPDKSTLIDSLKLLRIEGGQSAVNDAIYLAVKAAADYKASDSIRRAVVLVSDGEERNSYYNTDALVELLRAKNVQVFVIGIVNELDNENSFIRQSPRQAAEELLNRVASESGGRVFFPKSADDLLRVTAEIIDDLHSQYIVGYQSTTTDKKNFRKVEVKIPSTPGREKLIAITKSGYFVNPPNLEGKGKDKKKSK